MKHYGDITKINGAAVEPVDVIIGGSPCQDLSVAGKRAGLAGERSGLFMEQLRVIKEMRRADLERGRKGKDTRPRYMVFENVPGLFSSNKGADFGAVLQETVRIVCKEAPAVPIPKNGWPHAGCLTDVGGQYSIAWRVLDAQFWGVPQRRRRIALVADFGGLTAPEILFECKGVSGHYPQGRTPWKGAARTAESRFGTASTGIAPTYCIQGNCIGRADTAGCNGRGWTEGVSYTLNTIDRPAVTAYQLPLADVASTLRSGAGAPKHESDVKGRLVISSGVDASPVVYDARGNGDGKVAPTMTGDHQNRITDYTAIANTPCIRDGLQVSPTSTADSTDDGRDDMITAFSQNQREEVRDLRGKAGAIAAESGMHQQTFVLQGATIRPAQIDMLDKMTVRRLTPLECERLQGFPDGWTDIGKYMDGKGKWQNATDAKRYKALGNSIAIPPWTYVLSKLTLYCEGKPTMASLFDGIGGFPLIWERLNGCGSCIWASEIEDFPIAVTKYHFSPS